MKLISNSTLDYKDNTLPDFSIASEHKICISITALQVSKLIKSLNCRKATGPDKIQMAVLKDISPEISTLLAKLFTCRQDYGKCQLYALFLRMGLSLLVGYYLIL